MFEICMERITVARTKCDLNIWMTRSRAEVDFLAGTLCLSRFFLVGCGGILSGPNGTFSSPNYPNGYDHARTCEWLITVQTGYSVSLSILDFDMENSRNCTYDSLQASPCAFWNTVFLYLVLFCYAGLLLVYNTCMQTRSCFACRCVGW